MPFDSAQLARRGGAWPTLVALCAEDGTRSHRHPAALRSPLASMRDAADAIHCLCMLHARHPGVIDHAVSHADESLRSTLSAAAEGFSSERAWLVRLVAAAGPLPSTPGQAETDATITAQRHALDMLAQSDRAGCAVGAAAALVLDWHAIRSTLEATAERLGITIPPSYLPSEDEIADLVAAVPASAERATAFGAQQLLAQHRGLWDLLEARASARGKH